MIEDTVIVMQTLLNDQSGGADVAPLLTPPASFAEPMQTAELSQTIITTHYKCTPAHLSNCLCLSSLGLPMGSSKGLQSLFQINRCLTRIKSPSLTTQLQPRKSMGSIASFKVPVVANEPNVSSDLDQDLSFSLIILLQKHYAKDSTDRQKLQDAIAALKNQAPLEVPLVVAGKEVRIVTEGFLLLLTNHHQDKRLFRPHTTRSILPL